MPKPPQEIVLAMLGEQTALDKTPNFLGTPPPPQEIARAVTGGK
jgi:hypothetical protein